jgi:hypothetical protein
MAMEPTPTATEAMDSGPQTVVLTPSRDTTIYDEGVLANGAGEWVFVGMTRQGALRRTLLAFDVAGAIPAGATVQEATLALTVTQTTAEDVPVALHALGTPWSAGASDADVNEGKGIAAAAEDATWLGTGVGDALWATAGGDFANTPSATAVAGGRGVTVDWTSPEVLADVQGWLSDPSTNQGWMLIGDEGSTRTAKRFDSSENFSGFPEPKPPTLTITYVPAP